LSINIEISLILFLNRCELIRSKTFVCLKLTMCYFFAQLSPDEYKIQNNKQIMFQYYIMWCSNNNNDKGKASLRISITPNRKKKNLIDHQFKCFWNLDD
jgi:hypothetical protein